MTLWYLYIIENRFGHFYTGITTDVARRFEEHSLGSAKAAKALKGKGPLRLLYQAEVGSRSEALKLEASIKKLSRRQKQLLVEGISTLTT